MSRDKNWIEEIKDEEFVDIDGKTTIPLSVLQRLANEAGWLGSEVTVHDSVGPKGTVFYAVSKVFFKDGTFWSGAADCHSGNTEDPFIRFPAAIAESRSLARALKKALRLYDMLATEELGNTGQRTFKATGKIDAQVVRGIEVALERMKIDPMELIRNVVDPTRQDSISSLVELTAAEGAAAMQYLDECSKKKPSIKSVEDRTARKEALKKELEEAL